jgi:hypothetical protein
VTIGPSRNGRSVACVDHPQAGGSAIADIETQRGARDGSRVASAGCNVEAASFDLMGAAKGMPMTIILIKAGVNVTTVVYKNALPANVLLFNAWRARATGDIGAANDI